MDFQNILYVELPNIAWIFGYTSSQGIIKKATKTTTITSEELKKHTHIQKASRKIELKVSRFSVHLLQFLLHYTIHRNHNIC